jgi:hypothetical protein
MKNTILFLTLLLSFLLIGCNKCDPSNDTSGIVKKDAIIRAINGKGGNNFVRQPSDYNLPIEVSFDGGVTYEAVDYTQYSAFSLPTTASCSSGYLRDVSINQEESTVTYTVTITECDYCEGSTSINNWVLTEKVNSSFTPIFNIN